MTDHTLKPSAKEYSIKVLPGPILHVTVKTPGLDASATIQKINLDKKLAINLAFSLLRETVIASENKNDHP